MHDMYFGFLSPATQIRILKEQAERRERALQYNVIEWDEDKTKMSSSMPIRAASYDVSRYQLFSLEQAPPVDISTRGNMQTGLVWSPGKHFAYSNRLLPRNTPLSVFQGKKEGEVFFDGDIITPVLYQHRPTHHRQLDVWMSCTPAEMLSQRQGVRAAKGKVLVGGLGLGWLLRKVAEKKSVSEIILVEISQELLDWYGKKLCDEITESTGTPIKIYCDDVLNHMGKHGADTRHLIDIWPNYPNYRDYLPKEWRAAIEEVRYFWGWGVLENPENCRF